MFWTLNLRIEKLDWVLRLLWMEIKTPPLLGHDTKQAWGKIIVVDVHEKRFN